MLKAAERMISHGEKMAKEGEALAAAAKDIKETVEGLLQRPPKEE